MKRFVFVIAFIVGPAVNAQHPAVTGYLHEIFAPGSLTPVATRLIPAKEAVCDTEHPTDQGEGRINPQTLHFDDNDHQGQGCFLLIEAETLDLVPDGDGYVSTLTPYGMHGPLAARSDPSQPFGRWRVVPERPTRGLPSDPRVTGLVVR